MFVCLCVCVFVCLCVCVIVCLLGEDKIKILSVGLSFFQKFLIGVTTLLYLL